MVAPVAAFVQLPLDTLNTGKKRRTQTRVVGANTVHEDFVILTSERNTLGTYIASFAPVALPITAQNGVTGGALFFYNPVGAVNKIAVEKIRLQAQFNALGIDTLAGNLKVVKFTFTGAGSGAANAILPTKTSSPIPAASSRQAMTGLTIALVADVCTWFLPVMGLATGGAGVFNPMNIDWLADHEEEEIILVAGEGIVIYSAVNLTTANRLLSGAVHFSEFE